MTKWRENDLRTPGPQNVDGESAEFGTVNPWEAKKRPNRGDPAEEDSGTAENHDDQKQDTEDGGDDRAHDPDLP